MDIWDNPISRKHETQGERLKALLVRVMNLTGKISMFFLMLGFFQMGNVIIAAILQVNFDWLVGVAIMCFFISASIFSVFGLACSIYAFANKNYLWALGILIINILSVPYLWLRTREMNKILEREPEL